MTKKMTAKWNNRGKMPGSRQENPSFIWNSIYESGGFTGGKEQS